VAALFVVIGHEFHEFHEKDHCHLDIIGFEIQSFAVSPNRCLTPTSNYTRFQAGYGRDWV